MSHTPTTDGFQQEPADKKKATLGKRFLRLLDKILPQELRDAEADVLRRSRVVGGFSAFMFIMTLTMLPMLQWKEGFFSEPLNITIFAELFGYALNIYLLHKTRSYRIAGIIMCFQLFFMSVLFDYFMGGYSTLALMWLAATPLFTLFLAGRRWSFVFFGLLILFMAVTASLKLSGFTFPKPPTETPTEAIISTLFVIIFYATVFFGVAWMFELARLDAQDNLHKSMKKNQALLLARNAAQEANRAKSSFLATMSHELRTPLNAIIGYSEMLQEEFEDDSHLKEYALDIERIQSSGQHLLLLINDLLDLSKIEAGKMELHIEQFELITLLGNIESTLEPLLAKNDNRLSLVLGENLGGIVTDRTRLRQSLLNLLSNATKFTHQGEVTLYAKRTQKKGKDWFEFKIQDTGIGMSSKQLNSLFEKFTQGDTSTTRKYGGTGLGLAITKELCQLLGGTIEAESEKGKGSTFTFCIPASSSPSTRLGSGEFTASQEALDSFNSRDISQAHLPKATQVFPTALVIDDDPAVVDMLNRFLSKEGFRVVCTSSGEEGLRIAQTIQPKFIILDVLLDDIDGWQVLTQLKADEKLAEIPIIMQTIIDDQQKGFALGVMEYLTKPIQKDRLLKLVRKFLPEDVDATVMVVEDDDNARDLLHSILTKAGWQVAEANNGKRGLEALYKNKPDLILLDLMMPEMDGFTFLDHMQKQEQYADIPVIVITAKELNQDDRSQLKGSVHRILQKGAYSQRELLQRVRDLLTTHASTSS